MAAPLINCAEQSCLRKDNVLEGDVRNRTALQSHRLQLFADLYADGVGFHEKRRQSFGSERGVSGGEDHVDASFAGIAYKGFLAVEDVTNILLGSDQRVSSNSGSWAVLEDREAAEDLALGHARQILFFLIGCAPVLDRIGGNRVIVHDRSHCGAKARQILDHFHVADKAGRCAADVVRKQQSQKVMLGQCLHHCLRKFTRYDRARQR